MIFFQTNPRIANGDVADGHPRQILSCRFARRKHVRHEPCGPCGSSIGIKHSAGIAFWHRAYVDFRHDLHGPVIYNSGGVVARRTPHTGFCRLAGWSAIPDGTPLARAS